MRYVGVFWFVWLFLKPNVVFGEPVDDFDYPTNPGAVTCDFNVTCAARNHLGIDLRARAGEAVYAPANGVVREARLHRRYGATVIIEHQLGPAENATSIIGHMRLVDLAVRVGDTVTRGQVIGYAGTRAENGGWAPHVHWGVRRGLYDSSSVRCGSGSEWAYAGYTNCPETVVPQWYDTAELLERVFFDPTLTDDDDGLAESDGDCDDANADIYPGAAEFCNSVDDDCDSETDEDWSLLGESCSVRPTPFCERTGIWICEPLHRGTVCDADYEIRVELCNGFDDNCNGETDEDWPLLGSPCDVGTGECLRSGVWVCEPLERGIVCNAEYVSGTPEVCGDGLDNDCDGTADDGCCPSGLTNCGGSCVSLSNNPAHCGYCFHACTGAYACIGTECVYGCPDHYTLCSGTCVSLQTNPDNCGTCGHRCSSRVCSGWVCR